MKRPTDLIIDPHFKAVLCPYGTTPNPAPACWYRMHTCVSENFTMDDKLPKDPSGSLIRNALQAKKHWHVLDGAFATVHVGGFNHDTSMQFRTHQNNDTLIQSLRYTGVRILDQSLETESVFYVSPALPGSSQSILREKNNISRVVYKEQVDNGLDLEQAKKFIEMNVRQNFSMSGTMTAWLHMLDQRLLRDTEIEAQTCAWMILDQLHIWWPELIDWYLETRAMKNNLAP